MPAGEEEQTLHCINDDHGLVVVEPQPQQLVMHVVRIRAEQRPALAEALGHHHQRIDHRQPQQHQRSGGAHGAVRCLHEQHRQHGHTETQELAAAVAHENSRRKRVEAEEAQQCAAQRDRDHGNARVAARASKQEQRCGDQQRRTACQPVQAVREVDGVGDTQDEQSCQRQPDDWWTT